MHAHWQCVFYSVFASFLEPTCELVDDGAKSKRSDKVPIHRLHARHSAHCLSCRVCVCVCVWNQLNATGSRNKSFLAPEKANQTIRAHRESCRWLAAFIADPARRRRCTKRHQTSDHYLSQRFMHTGQATTKLATVGFTDFSRLPYYSDPLTGRSFRYWRPFSW